MKYIKTNERLTNLDISLSIFINKRTQNGLYIDEKAANFIVKSKSSQNKIATSIDSGINSNSGVPLLFIKKLYIKDRCIYAQSYVVNNDESIKLMEVFDKIKIRPVFMIIDSHIKESEDTKDISKLIRIVRYKIELEKQNEPIK